MNANLEISDLTACRAFLAAWVPIHLVDLYLKFSAYLGLFQGLIRQAYLRVDDSFILSGVILAQVHPELSAHVDMERYDVGVKPLALTNILKFWGKRLSRIYPVHLATLLHISIEFPCHHTGNRWLGRLISAGD